MSGSSGAAQGAPTAEGATEQVLEVYERAQKTRQQLEQEVDEIRIQLARDSLVHFIEYVIRDSHTGLPVKCAEIHKSWCKHIEEHLDSPHDVGILAPWGHGKSQIVAIALVLWLIGKNANHRIGVICNSDDNAKKRVTSIGQYIVESEAYHKVFPHIRPAKRRSWNEHRLEVARDVIATEGTVEAAGIETTGTGARFDIMVYDDIVDQKDCDSETIRKGRISKFSNIWSSRIEPHGKSFYIATRWHKHDTTNEALQRENWRFLVQAVSDDITHIVEPPADYIHYSTVVNRKKPKKVSLWQAKWSEEAVRKAVGRLGHRAFARGFRQKPLSEDDTLFREDAVDKTCRWSLSVSDAAPPEWPRYQGVDLSGEKRPGVAMVVIARDPKTGHKVLVEIKRGMWGWSVKTARTIYEMHVKHGCRITVVENNSAQQTMIALIRQLPGAGDIPIRGYTTGKQKADPVEGLPGLAVEMENGAWIFPLAHVRSEQHLLASSQIAEVVLIRELLEYPQGVNSDTVMGLWFANHAANTGRKVMMPGVYHGVGRGRVFGAATGQTFGSGYRETKLPAAKVG